MSSKELSDRMHVTASQIRQDLNCFGGFGQQGYGYNVELLHNEIAAILGIPEPFNVIIIGAGNMGQAIAKYDKFKKRGFTFTGIFDKNPDILGNDINGLKVLHIDTLEEFLKTNKVDIAILLLQKKMQKKWQ